MNIATLFFTLLLTTSHDPPSRHLPPSVLGDADHVNVGMPPHRALRKLAAVLHSTILFACNSRE